MAYDDLPVAVIRYDILALGEETIEYAARFASVADWMSASVPESYYLCTLVRECGEAVSKLRRSGEEVPEEWEEIRLFRNEQSHVYYDRDYLRVWELSQTLVPKMVESLSQGLSRLPGYDPHKPDRGGYFDDLS